MDTGFSWNWRERDLMTNLSNCASDRNFIKVRGPPFLYSWNKHCPDTVFGRLLNEILHSPIHYRISLHFITKKAGTKIRIYFRISEQKHGCKFTMHTKTPLHRQVQMMAHLLKTCSKLIPILSNQEEQAHLLTLCSLTFIVWMDVCNLSWNSHVQRSIQLLGGE